MSPAAASRSGRVPDEASRWSSARSTLTAALEGDLGALDSEARVVDGGAEHRKRPAQGAARGEAVGLGPEHGGQLVACEGPRLGGDDSDDRERLARVDGDEAVGDQHLERAEERITRRDVVAAVIDATVARDASFP